MNMAPAPELLVFMSVAPAPVSVRFHTLIFSIVLVCPKFNGKRITSSTQNKENIPNIFQ